MTKLLAGGVLPLSILVFLAPVASARSVGAWSGKPLDGLSLNTCYGESAGAVTGTGNLTGCPAAGGPRWEVNLPVDSAKDYVVQFAATIGNSGSTSTCCTAYAVTSTGSLSTSNELCVHDTTMKVQQPLTKVTVQSGGQLYLACQGLFFAATQIGVVSWN